MAWYEGRALVAVSTSPADPAKQAKEALGARLKGLRQDAGLSARTLAAATG